MDCEQGERSGDGWTGNREEEVEMDWEQKEISEDGPGTDIKKWRWIWNRERERKERRWSGKSKKKVEMEIDWEMEMREKGVEMDRKQKERSGDVLGTRKERIDDRLEQREISEDGLGAEIKE
jgi:hypothetical protein